MKAKALLLVALTLFAFATALITTVVQPVLGFRVGSQSFIRYSDKPVQPSGDPIDGEGKFPH